MAMTMNEYQLQASQTAVYPEAGQGTTNALAYTTLGLCGEAGEVAERVKKVIRDQGGQLSEATRLTLMRELGDVLWYVAMAAAELGRSLETVATHNMRKLGDRQERQVLHGEGDNR